MQTISSSQFLSEQRKGFYLSDLRLKPHRIFTSFHHCCLMSWKEEDITPCSTFVLETVNTAESISGQLPSRIQARLNDPIYGDTSHYARSMNPLEHRPRETNLPILSQDDLKEKIQEPDTLGPYLAGFAIGWFTWVFGLLLCIFAGKGDRSAALRKGLILGSLVVSVPLILVLIFIIVIINKLNLFLDKFPLGLLRDVLIGKISN